jgi:integrase/recombinase XerD
MVRKFTLSQAFNGMILEKRGAGISPNTIADYLNTLKKAIMFFEDDPPFTSIDRADLVQFFAWLGDVEVTPDGVASRGTFKLGAKSRRNIHTNLSALWTWAVNCGYTDRNIVRTIQAPDVEETVIDPLTADEITILIKSCDTVRTYQLRSAKPIARSRSTAARDKFIIMLLYDTGLRAQELCDLVLGDVDFFQRKIHIKHGKGDKPRTVRFGKRAAKLMWEYLGDRLQASDRSEPLILVDEHGSSRAMNRHVLRRLLKRIGDRAGIKSVHPHRLRHSFATDYLRNGGKMIALQELLGHSDLEMVRRYAKFVEADIAVDHAIASPADKLRL